MYYNMSCYGVNIERYNIMRGYGVNLERNFNIKDYGVIIRTYGVIFWGLGVNFV